MGLFRLSVLVLFAIASSADAGNIIQVPLRWCALKNTPAVTNPAGVGEPDTDNVLWRRHERVTDHIYLAQGADITFRSAFEAQVRDTNSFPVIDDPTISPGSQEGDIIDPDLDNSTELKQALAACNTAWDALSRQFRVPFVGVPAVNVRQFVTSDGTVTSKAGQGSFNFTWPGNFSFDDICLDPSRVTTNGDGIYAFVKDNSFTLGTDPNDTILGHELGHVLFLGHGNGKDDDGDGVYDEFCDKTGELPTPATLMTPGALSSVLTAAQQATVRTVAKKTSGAQLDPPGTVINADTVGDRRADPIGDVTDGSIDLMTAGMADNTVTGTTRVSHVLFGDIPTSATRQYLLFADLDGNPATGGSPSTLGFTTGFQGAELVTRVLVAPAGEFQVVEATVWRFVGATFVQQTDPAIHADLTYSVAPDSGQRVLLVVSLSVPDTVRGPMAPTVPIQAVAEQLIPQSASALTAGERDRLPADADGRADLFMVPPRFPACGTDAAQAQAGATVTVEAKDLLPERMAKVILGDAMVGSGTTDAAGGIRVSFVVPPNAPLGQRLMTVGIAGTALTADCAFTVVGGPVVCGDHILSPGEQCDDGNTVAGDCCSATCQFEAGSCDDHDACTQTDVCQNGTCAGSPVVCPDPDQCHVPGTCDPQTGLCSNPTKPDGFACDDGDFCTNVDACRNGVCNGNHVGADSDADGYCDVWENQVGCNAHDFFEIPPQGNAIKGTRGSGAASILMTFAQPRNRRVRMATDPSCASSGVCGPTKFCTAGKIGDPCVAAADCNEATNACRVIVNYAATADIQLRSAVMNRVPIAGFTPAQPGCARKVDVLPVGHTHVNRLRLVATGTVQSRPRRERNLFTYLK